MDSTLSGNGSDDNTFYLFPKLPNELRLMVWEEALKFPRIIETENQAAELPHLVSVPGIKNTSRKPPALLLVNQEARTEALKKYELRAFADPSQLPLQLVTIYYNPLVDIIYFEREVQRGSMAMFFEAAHRNNKTIPRVSFDAEYCICAALHLVFSMKNLHGIHPPSSGQYGCPGLKEVFVVVDSSGKSGQIDQKANFRSAITTTRGLSPDELVHLDLIQKKIQQVNDDGGVDDCGPTPWLGDNKPTFHLVSLVHN